MILQTLTNLKILKNICLLTLVFSSNENINVQFKSIKAEGF